MTFAAVEIDLKASRRFLDDARRLPASVASNLRDTVELIRLAQPPDWDEFVKALTGLRNAVMHPVREVVGARRHVEELQQLEEMTRALMRACYEALDLQAPGGASVGGVEG